MRALRGRTSRAAALVLNSVLRRTQRARSPAARSRLHASRRARRRRQDHGEVPRRVRPRDAHVHAYRAFSSPQLFGVPAVFAFTVAAMDGRGGVSTSSFGVRVVADDAAAAADKNANANAAAGSDDNVNVDDYGDNANSTAAAAPSPSPSAAPGAIVGPAGNVTTRASTGTFCVIVKNCSHHFSHRQRSLTRGSACIAAQHRAVRHPHRRRTRTQARIDRLEMSVAARWRVRRRSSSSSPLSCSSPAPHWERWRTAPTANVAAFDAL